MKIILIFCNYINKILIIIQICIYRILLLFNYIYLNEYINLFLYGIFYVNVKLFYHIVNDIDSL